MPHEIFELCSQSSCSECTNPCKVDTQIPCSPDCDYLDSNGNPSDYVCLMCDAIEDKEKDILAHDLRVDGEVICPECNRGRVVRRDYDEYLNTYLLQYMEDEGKEKVKIKEHFGSERLENKDYFVECIECFAKFQSNSLGNADLSKVTKKGIDVKEVS